MSKSLLIILFIGGLLFCRSQSSSNISNLGTIGEIKLEALRDTKWFSNLFYRYEVDSITLSEIKNNNILQDLRFTVYIGLWCSDSRTFLPKLLKILEHLDIKQDCYKVIKVNNSKTEPFKSLKLDNINYVPTTIIYDGTRELNRITEFTNESIEKDLVRIILKKPYIPFR